MDFFHLYSSRPQPFLVKEASFDRLRMSGHFIPGIPARLAPE